jgi:hypothetical protein
MREFKLSNVKATGRTAGDAHFSKVKLLLPLNGSNSATSTSDSSDEGNSITFNGNAQISTAQSKFGGSSLLLDGAGDYLQVANQDYFDFGSNDFTIECWFYFDSSSSETYNTLLDMGNGSAAGTGPFWTAVKKDSGTYYIGAALDSTTAGDWDVLDNLAIATLSASTWHHFAVSRAGSNFKVFLNGTSVATATSSSAMRDENSALQIGARGQNTASHYFKGYIDDVRITNGLARYTSNFTAPTSAHLTSAGDVNLPLVIDADATGVRVDHVGTSNQKKTSKAWVNFNGTGTVAIRDSYNVSSITDQATGFYVANFSAVMSDTNYCATVSSGWNTVTWGIPMFGTISGESTPFTASKVGVTLNDPSDTDTDNAYVMIQVFGN